MEGIDELFDELFDDSFNEETLDNTCPNCGIEYDEIDYEYQICHHCDYDNS
jgi:hypothetical protein